MVGHQPMAFLGSLRVGARLSVSTGHHRLPETIENAVSLACYASVNGAASMGKSRNAPSLPVVRVLRLEWAAFRIGSEAVIEIDGAAADRDARWRQAARVLVDDDGFAVCSH